MKKIKLGIVGVGKIVHDQHLPAITKNAEFEIVATASRNGFIEDIPAYLSIEEMVAATPDLQAVALCMPPQYRYENAQFALRNNLHTLLEKPPGATVCEVEHLNDLAKQNEKTLFATWHSRHGAAVQAAKTQIIGRTLKSVVVIWKEDVRKWHPGQDWIWQAGGLGVFDPGINGLSILTELLTERVFVRSSKLLFPENKAAPIAAFLNFVTANQLKIELEFDWRQNDNEVWDIIVRTEEGEIRLTDGGSRLLLDGMQQQFTKGNEYESIYQRFAQLITKGQSDVDLRPLKLTADAFLLGERKTLDPFVD
jgi:D-galactose 1-dehydrogenase